MKMSNNPAKYEVLIKQYFRSILDISVINNNDKEIFVRCFFVVTMASTLSFNHGK